MAIYHKGYNINKNGIGETEKEAEQNANIPSECEINFSLIIEEIK